MNRASIEKEFEEFVEKCSDDGMCAGHISRLYGANDIKSFLFEKIGEVLAEVDEKAFQLMKEYKKTAFTHPNLRGTGTDWLRKLRKQISSIYASYKQPQP